MKTTRLITLMTLALGCGDSSDSGGSSGSGLGTGGSAGEDGGDGGDGTGGGADPTGGGTDGGDGGSDSGGGFTDAPDIGGEVPPPPEEEDPADFRVPRASGKFVYSASQSTSRVAVINTANLLIDVVDSGIGPTVVTAIPGQTGSSGKVAVLCEGSDEVTFITTSGDLSNTIELRDVAPGANNMVASPDGKFVIAYHDVDSPEGGGGAGSDQEISVIATTGSKKVWRLTVGSHPREVLYADDSGTAYISTDAGVNVIPLGDLDNVGIPRIVPVAVDNAIDPSKLEVFISVTQDQAVARFEGEYWIAVTDLTTEEQEVYNLSGFPTDLDISADGTYAIAMLPRKTGSTIFEFSLPVTPQGYAETPVGQEYVGLAKIAPTDDKALLYTTVDPWEYEPGMGPLGDPRKRVTVARRDGPGDWSDQVTLFTEQPIRSVGIAPDGNNAVMLHDEAASLNPSAPWPYTLIDLISPFPFKKVQNVEADPGPVVYTPDGTRAAVLLRDDARGVKRVDMVNLGNFIVKDLGLGSPPEGAGYVENTDKLFISQAHPSGRITFVDQAGKPQTVTGYELNDAVKD